MKIPVYFVFSPSVALGEASCAAGYSWLAVSSVWTTHETDRSGLAHSREDLQAAFWSHFCAQLIEDNESQAHRSFRIRCLELGFVGCWEVTETRAGGAAEDLLDSGLEAAAYLQSREGLRA